MEIMRVIDSTYMHCQKMNYRILALMHNIIEDVRKNPVRSLFLFVTCLHAAVAIFLYTTEFNPFGNGGGDWSRYHQEGVYISQVIQGNRNVEAPGRIHEYGVFVGFLYAVFGPNMLIGMLLNTILSGIAVVFLYKIMVFSGISQRIGMILSIGSAFYPSFIFYTSFLLKDSLVVALVLGLLYGSLLLLHSFSWRYFAVFYMALGGLFLFRVYAGHAMLFAFLIGWTILGSESFKKRIIMVMFFLTIFGFLPQVAGYGYYGIDLFSRYLNIERITYYREVVYTPEHRINSLVQQKINERKENDRTNINTKKDKETEENIADIAKKQEIKRIEESVGSAGGGSTINIGTDFDNPSMFIYNYIRSFLVVLLGPFPWQVEGSQRLSLGEMIPWYVIFFAISGGVFFAIKKRSPILVLLLFSLLLVGVLALFASNLGALTRIRISAFLALIPFAGIFLQEYKWVHRFLEYPKGVLGLSVFRKNILKQTK